MPEKTKVLVYIYRENNQGFEILVFDHVDFPEAGTQIIGGTVEDGEDLREALLREMIEESGLVFHIVDVYPIGQSVYYRKDREEKNLRHYFKIEGAHLDDEWIHEVDSPGADCGLKFRFYWMKTDEATLKLVGNMAELVSKL